MRSGFLILLSKLVTNLEMADSTQMAFRYPIVRKCADRDGETITLGLNPAGMTGASANSTTAKFH